MSCYLLPGNLCAPSLMHDTQGAYVCARVEGTDAASGSPGNGEAYSDLLLWNAERRRRTTRRFTQGEALDYS